VIPRGNASWGRHRCANGERWHTYGVVPPARRHHAPPFSASGYSGRRARRAPRRHREEWTRVAALVFPDASTNPAAAAARRWLIGRAPAPLRLLAITRRPSQRRVFAARSGAPARIRPYGPRAYSPAEPPPRSTCEWRIRRSLLRTRCVSTMSRGPRRVIGPTTVRLPPIGAETRPSAGRIRTRRRRTPCPPRMRAMLVVVVLELD